MNTTFSHKQIFQLPELALQCGDLLSGIDIAYETFGTLNQDKSNAVLVCHALTGDSHVAGFYSAQDRKAGWWNDFVGEGKAIDTNQFFVICSNVVGGCAGSTGPSSLDPDTSAPYGLTFPFITIKDMVRAQEALVSSLGIKALYATVGGSMGGMQVLEWALTYPEMCQRYIMMACAPYQSPQNIALHEVGRKAIMMDVNWQNGNYSADKKPENGLAVARMIAHITYLSEATMNKKFGRRLQGKESLDFALYNEFEIESYLDYQGRSFIQRFDANSYLYITRAVDYFDYSEGRLKESLASVRKSFSGESKFLIVSFSSDWLYPPSQALEIVKALQYNNLPVTYCEVESDYGHDAFFVESEKLSPLLRNFCN